MYIYIYIDFLFIEISIIMSSEEEILNNCSINEIKRFSFDGKLLLAKCIKCYDGDTITVIMLFNKCIYKFSIRLSGIDAAEIKSKCNEEKKMALEAKQVLEKIILNQLIRLKCKKFDKYGRILAEVYPYHLDTNKLEWKNSVNSLMIEKKLAYLYDGGTKKKFDEKNFV